ncbi:hypothetical protein PYCC9005_000056 [Savitreella phatthalungensis]
MRGQLFLVHSTQVVFAAMVVTFGNVDLALDSARWGLSCLVPLEFQGLYDVKDLLQIPQELMSILGHDLLHSSLSMATEQSSWICSRYDASGALNEQESTAISPDGTTVAWLPRGRQPGRRKHFERLAFGRSASVDEVLASLAREEQAKAERIDKHNIGMTMKEMAARIFSYDVDSVNVRHDRAPTSIEPSASQSTSQPGGQPRRQPAIPAWLTDDDVLYQCQTAGSIQFADTVQQKLRLPDARIELFARLRSRVPLASFGPAFIQQEMQPGHESRRKKRKLPVMLLVDHAQLVMPKHSLPAARFLPPGQDHVIKDIEAILRQNATTEDELEQVHTNAVAILRQRKDQAEQIAFELNGNRTTHEVRGRCNLNSSL